MDKKVTKFRVGNIEMFNHGHIMVIHDLNTNGICLFTIEEAETLHDTMVHYEFKELNTDFGSVIIDEKDFGAIRRLVKKHLDLLHSSV